MAENCRGVNAATEDKKGQPFALPRGWVRDYAVFRSWEGPSKFITLVGTTPVLKPCPRILQT